MAPYRVAIIAGQLVVGGAEKQLYIWLSNLDRKLFDPVVVTLHPDAGDYWEKPIRSLGIPVFEESHRRSWGARLFSIVNHLKQHKPQLIHGWHLFASPYAGLAGMRLGAKSIGSHRGSAESFRTNATEAMFTRLLVDRLVVNSQSVATALGGRHPRKARLLRVIQNAVESEACDKQGARRAISSAYGVSQDGLWLGSMGRLIPQKGFDTILEIVHSLQNRVKNLRLFLIGDGPERERLQAKVKELGLLNAVTFAGEDPNARKWLSALDIFCYASTDEGQPNAVMEAAAGGVPIVAWRTPFLEELLKNDHSGLLVDQGDLRGFADSLLRLACAPELRASVANEARRGILHEFSKDRFVQSLTSVYLELLQGNGNPMEAHQ